MSLIHAFEKLGQGIDILATGPGPINERLTEAFLRALAEVREDALPPEARPRWRQVWHRVTAVQGKPNEGRLVASIGTLHEDEATLVAEQIVTIHAIVQLAIPMKNARTANAGPLPQTPGPWLQAPAVARGPAGTTNSRRKGEPA